MAQARTAVSQRTAFRVALPSMLVVLLAVAALLGPGVPLAVRETVSSLALLVAGLAATVCCGRRARLTSGRRRRSWLLFTAAAGVAMLSYVVGAVVGVDNVGAPTVVTDVILLVAMVLAIVGLGTFPNAMRRGADPVVMALDGVVTGGGVLAIAAVLVYPELLPSSTDLGRRVTDVLFPVLDIVLVTMALLLVVRAAGRDRPSLLLIGGGFLSNAVTDLYYAVVAARGDYAFGGRLELGWIAGYLAISLAALHPGEPDDEAEPSDLATWSTRSAVLVFTVIITAGVVQVAFGPKLAGPTALLWLVLIVAAGARQTLLAADNASLRRGLERRVREQTTDLRRLARQTEVLLTSVGDGIYGVDNRGRVTFVNPSGAEALGHAPEALLGRHAHDLFHAPDEHGVPHPPEGCYVTEAIRSGIVAHPEEDTYVRADGGRFPVEITASPLVDEERRLGAVVVFRDVTQRHEVDRMKNEFLSVVSHELRTPLTSIRGSLGLLAGGALGELNPRARTMVQHAAQSSERLTRLINDLLDIERIQSGSRQMDLHPAQARELVVSAVRQIEGMAATAGVRVEVGDCSGQALVDEDRIMQTLTNLLGNAIKYSHEGGLVVADAWPQDGEVVFRVRDEGRGIPPDKLESIFERFEQVDSSDARQQEGTGLGLAISRSIVERHGGRIWAVSDLGFGTTLFFTLPAGSQQSADRSPHGATEVVRP